MYAENHGLTRSIHLDQAKCLVGHQVNTFCKKKNIEVTDAPVKSHRVIGLIEGLNGQLIIDWHLSKKNWLLTR